MNLPRTYGLRLRLIALVRAAVAPFVFLIAMVARQHRLEGRLHDPTMSFIQKPFTAENLAIRVRKVLDAAA